MSIALAHAIVTRLNMQPVLISQAHSNQMVEAVMGLAKETDESRAEAQATSRAQMLAGYGFTQEKPEKPFMYSNGVAFIPVNGLLLNRYNYGSSYATGYNFIRTQMNAALDDADVKLIVFDCHSGGGEAAGCFELCAEIRASRERKPSLAVVDSASYSACYAIASSASRVSVIKSGGVGSIGVVAMHVDVSKALSDFGIKVTFIHSGDHKVDGNMFEPLPEPVRKSIQSRVDATRQEFVNLVATNRGLDPKVVYNTEAACFSAAEGLDLGLIDVIAQPAEAVQTFSNELSRSKPAKETFMSTVKPGAEGSQAAADTTQPAASTANTADAAKAERARISGIMGHANAKDRPALANHLAFNTQLTVEEAGAMLGAAAVEKKDEPKKEGSAFAAAMDNGKHPEVGAGAEAGGEKQTIAQRMLANHSAATGTKYDVKH